MKKGNQLVTFTAILEAVSNSMSFPKGIYDIDNLEYRLMAPDMKLYFFKIPKELKDRIIRHHEESDGSWCLKYGKNKECQEGKLYPDTILDPNT